MSDPLDAFAAFDPFGGLPPDAEEPDGSAQEAPAPSAEASARSTKGPSSERTAAEPSGKPRAEPLADPSDPARVTTRRWGSTRRSLGVTERVGPKPAPVTTNPPGAETRPAATSEKSSARATESPPTPTPAADPAPEATPAPDPALGAVRAIALPELRAAVTRLRGHRHEAEIVNELDAESDPCLAMRLRPDAGPLGFAAAGPTSYARFEFRLAGPGEADPAVGVRVIAGYTPAGAGTRFILLGCMPVQALTPDWVSQSIVEFVARTLDR